MVDEKSDTQKATFSLLSNGRNTVTTRLSGATVRHVEACRGGEEEDGVEEEEEDRVGEVTVVLCAACQCRFASAILERGRQELHNQESRSRNWEGVIMASCT